MSTVCSHKIKLTIMSLLMILVLLITWTAAPLSYSRAVLAEVTLAGEVVMTLAALASLMMIALGASGMDGALRNQAAATGTQPLTYVGQLLNRWLTNSASNMGFSVLAQKMQQGLSYLPDGTLYLDSDATAAVADFQRWAWDSEGGDLSTYAVIGEATEDYLLIGGVRYPVYYFEIPVTVNGITYLTAPTVYDSTYDYFLAVGNTGLADTVAITVCAVQSGNNYSVRFCPNTTGYYRSINTNGSYVSNQYSVQANIWTQRQSFNYVDNPQFRVLGPIVDAVPNNPWSYDIQSGSGTVIGDVNTFVGPMQQGQGTQLPLANTVTVSADAAARLHLDNYLRAVAAAYAGTGTASVPVTDVGTGDEDTLPLSVPLDTPIGVTGVSDMAIDQSGSVAGSDVVATDFEGLDDYTMDLTQFFPFCVPFDLAYLFEKLRADPEALVIDWHFMIPYLDVDIPVQIDLSPFDSIAQLLRSLEVIAFIVALLVGTKNLIQGGD